MIKSIVTCGMAALLASACQKQNPLNPTDTAYVTPGPLVSRKEKPPKFKYHKLTMWKTGEAAGWCSGSPGDCVTITPDITIFVMVKAKIDTLTEKNSSEMVGATFRLREMNEFNNKLDDAFVTKLKSGNYYLAKAKDNGIYASYLVGPSYPVTLKNFEFAIQGQYKLKFGAEGLISTP